MDERVSSDDILLNAKPSDKELVVSILSNAFDTNQSVNYIVQQDHHRIKRIRKLMAYSYKVCAAFGKVYLSADKKACALVLFPDQKRFTLQSALWDMQLIFSVIGLGNIRKALNREAKIKKIQPETNMYYIWFIGVNPIYQGSGIGTQMMKALIEDSERYARPIYLETSTLKNIPWYQSFGFKIYQELQLSYTLFFLKRLNTRLYV